MNIITSFVTKILHVNFKETVERMMWYLLQQIWVVLATMLDGKSMSSKMASSTNHTTLLKKSKCHKISPSQIWV